MIREKCDHSTCDDQKKKKKSTVQVVDAQGPVLAVLGDKWLGTK